MSACRRVRTVDFAERHLRFSERAKANEGAGLSEECVADDELKPGSSRFIDQFVTHGINLPASLFRPDAQIDA